MTLSKRSIEMLIDLIEIKISHMDISDRQDARDLQILERCRAELRAINRGGAAVVPFAPQNRAGTPRAAL